MSELAHIPMGIAAAFGISLLISAVAARVGRHREDSSGPRWGTALGLGTGYVVGHAAVQEWLGRGRLQEAWDQLRMWEFGKTDFPLFPSMMVDWMPWLATLAMGVGVLDGVRPAPLWAKWENRLILTALTLGLLSALFTNGTWEFRQGALWCGALGASMLIFWSILDARATDLGASMPLVLLVMAIGLTLTQITARSIVMTNLAAVLAGALGGLWVVSWFTTRLTLSRAAIPVFVVIYAASIVCGLFYYELHVYSAVALAIAPLATYVDRIGVVSCLSPRKLAIARTLTLVIPLGAAIGIAYANRAEDLSAEGYGVNLGAHLGHQGDT